MVYFFIKLKYRLKNTDTWVNRIHRKQKSAMS